MVEEETSMTKAFDIERWTPASRMGFAGIAVLVALFAVAPVLLKSGTLDRITALFIYIMLAAMWNALAGYGGLVSIGQRGQPIHINFCCCSNRGICGVADFLFHAASQRWRICNWHVGAR
jgi:hypothetical protein